MQKLLTLSLTLIPLFSYATHELALAPSLTSDYVVRNDYDHPISIMSISKGKCVSLTDKDKNDIQLPLIIDSAKRQKMLLNYATSAACISSSKTINFTIKDSKNSENTTFTFYRHPIYELNKLKDWKVNVLPFSSNSKIDAKVDCFVKKDNVEVNPGKGEDCLYPKSAMLGKADKINLRITLGK